METIQPRVWLVYSYFSTLHLILWLEMSEDLSQVKFIGPVKQFYKKVYSFMAMPLTPDKIWVFLSFSFVYILLDGSVTIANRQIEWN